MKERSRMEMNWRKLYVLLRLPPTVERDRKITNKLNDIPPRERAIITNVRDETA